MKGSQMDDGEIEITPAMIEAGLSVWATSGRLIEGLGAGDRILVQECYMAMWRARFAKPKNATVGLVGVSGTGAAFGA